MREGRVASAEHSVHHAPGFSSHAEPADAPAPAAAVPSGQRRRWYRLFGHRAD
jgi:hypothetical protein